MVVNREKAAQRAEASRTNVPGTCQKWTRTQFSAPSAGDVDHDGDADAMDGWKSEPAGKRHPSRKPPRGVPVAYSGGSQGYGHRAISLGNGMIRSTDAGGSGKVATVALDWPEKHWGLKYLGWSDTIDGILIPKGPAQAKPKKPVSKIISEVIAGKWGTGAERKKRLIAAGYDYDQIQNGVNKKLATKKSIVAVAKEVLKGKWGNGAVRKNKLTAAGYNYQKVQAEVNKLLK